MRKYLPKSSILMLVLTSALAMAILVACQGPAGPAGEPGLPGNSGAYVKKTVVMSPGDYICGCLGQSCGNSDSLCFRGCSEVCKTCRTPFMK